jgi:hypothetical protein
MNIAYFTLSGRGLIDDCLSVVVARLQSHGLQLSGIIRALPVNHHAHACDMNLRVLPDGPLCRISQALGSGSRGCRLNADAIETLSVEVDARLARSDLLVINKFGKQESLGRGMRPAIARAVDLGIPVLIGVNGLNLDEFYRFTDGSATKLEPEVNAIFTWAMLACDAHHLASC